jgi:hypothetical protein
VPVLLALVKGMRLALLAVCSGNPASSATHPTPHSPHQLRHDPSRPSQRRPTDLQTVRKRLQNHRKSNTLLSAHLPEDKSTGYKGFINDVLSPSSAAISSIPTP